MSLKFGFVIFWQKDFGAKAAHKMLVKLTPGGSIFSRNVLQLLFSENSTTTRKNSSRFGIHRILEEKKKFGACLTKFKNNKILFNKISDRFLLRTIYLLGERASLGFCQIHYWNYA